MSHNGWNHLETDVGADPKAEKHDTSELSKGRLLLDGTKRLSGHTGRQLWWEWALLAPGLQHAG